MDNSQDFHLVADDHVNDPVRRLVDLTDLQLFQPPDNAPRPWELSDLLAAPRQAVGQSLCAGPAMIAG